LETTHIEAMIAELQADAATEPELQELLAAIADRNGADAQPEDLARGARFVVAYIERVPYMVKVAWTAASNVGLEEEMRRILQMVETYWQEADDVIPDDLGVIGILDDAYCSLTSLQVASDHYRLQTGKHLFPDDLTDANRAVREIIGEPYASELDRIVIRTMQDAGLIESVKALANEEKKLNFATNSTIWSHDPAGKIDVGDLARLGISRGDS
jgi:uncharacterized membrane protein YkvA (DUF1232 family)